VLMKHLVVVFAAVLLWSVGAVAEDCTVNVYRPKEGPALRHGRMAVVVDGKKLANLRHNDQTQITVACGKRIFATPGDNARWVFTLQPDTEYWLRIETNVGFLSVVRTVELVSKDRAEAELGVLRATAAPSTSAR
jgi:hypothetical protein